MKRITKILIWIIGLASSKTVKLITMIIGAYIIAYWVLRIISTPFIWLLS